MDPASNLLYYFNTESNKVTWDRPEEMGPAATGTEAAGVYFCEGISATRGGKRVQHLVRALHGRALAERTWKRTSRVQVRCRPRLGVDEGGQDAWPQLLLHALRPR